MPNNPLQDYLDSLYGDKKPLPTFSTLYQTSPYQSPAIENYLSQIFGNEVKIKEEKEKPKKSFLRSLADPLYSMASGLYKGAGNVVDTLDWLAYQTSSGKAAGLPRPKTLGSDISGLLGEQGAQMEEAGFEKGTIPEKLYSGAGKTLIDILALKGLGATGLGFAALPAYGAAEGAKEGGWKGAALGAAEGAVTGGILHGIAKLPSSWRFPVGFTTGFTTTPGDLADKVSSGILMGGMSLGGEKKTTKEFFAKPQTPLTQSEMAILQQVRQGVISNDEGAIRSMVERPEVMSLFKKKPRQVITALKTELVDRFAPVEEFVKQVENISGKTVDFQNNLYNLTRLFAGREGVTQAAFNELHDIFRPVRKLRPELEELLLAERALERAGREITNPSGVKETVNPVTGQKTIVRGAVTGTEAASAITALKFRLKPEQYQKLQDATQGFYDWADTWILKPLVDSGVVSKKNYQTIKANNNYWVPFEALKYFDPKGDSFNLGDEFFSVRGQNVVKAMTGASGKILPPFESIVDTLHKSNVIAEKNAMLNKLIGYRQLDPAIKKLIVPAKKDTKIIDTEHFEDLKVMMNGKVTRWLIPKDLGEGLKHLDMKGVDLFSKLIKQSSALFRAGTTSWYLPFSLGNAPRDFKMALLCNKSGFNPINWTTGLWHGLRTSFGFPSKLYTEYLKSHGAFSGLIHRNAKVAADRLFQPKGAEVAKEAALFIKNLAQAVELAPRLGVFQRAMGQGAALHRKPHAGSLLEAGLEARAATIDFSRSGHLMRVMNQYVPFINARLQAKVNLLERFSDPETRGPAMAKAMLWVVMPSLSSYFYNVLHHPDLYKEIPNYVKDNYDFIILGSKKDDKGRVVPDYIKLTKGDVEQVLVNPTISLLEYIRGGDPKKIHEVALNWLSEAAPIPFEREGKLSLTRFLAGVVPPAFRSPIEFAMGKTLFTEREMVPWELKRLKAEEQYTEKTPEVYKALGKKLHSSPIKLQNLARGVGGAVAYWPTPEGLLSQFGGRVRGTTGAESLNRAYKIQKKAEEGYFTARKKMEDLLKAGNENGALQERAKWDQEFVGLLMQMGKLTKQPLSELLTTPFYKMYSFQDKDVKRLLKQQQEPWGIGLEKKLKYEFYKPGH